MNSKGIELAASLIVILIASIIIFGLALGITYKIFCASAAKVEQLDSQTEKLVEQKLDSGARVAMPVNTKTAAGSASFCGGGSSPSAAYALGIRNDNTWSTRFTVHCKYEGVEQNDKLTMPDSPSILADCSNVIQQSGDVTLDAKMKTTKIVVINAPPGIEKGTHMFTISVCDKAILPCDSQLGPYQQGVNGFYGAASMYLTIK